MLNALDGARLMQSRGLSVVRVHPNSKQPVGENSGSKATTNPEVISTWPQDSNYGIMPRGRIVILDLDAPKGAGDPTVSETWRSLRPARTLTTKTPKGGRHLFYRLPQGVEPEDIDNSIKRIPGVDVFAHGQKQVVGAGTTIDGKAYEIVHDEPIAEVPPHILERVRRRPGARGRGRPHPA
jgi:hypothetical protein